MQDAALGRVAVLLPLLLDMNQSALAFAEEQVLQGGEGQKVGFGKQDLYFLLKN